MQFKFDLNKKQCWVRLGGALSAPNISTRNGISFCILFLVENIFKTMNVLGPQF